MIWTLNKVITEVFSGMFLCCIQGTILYFVWKIIGKYMERKDYVEASYWMWKVVLLTFCMPVTWVYMINMETKRWLFQPTMKIGMAVAALGFVWLIGFLITLFHLIRQYARIRRDVKRSDQCEAWVQELLEEIKTELRMKTPVSVVTQKNAGNPMLYGIFHPKIILPRQYTKKELRVIFYHELIHQKHHDLLWKQLANIVRCIHWFHPVLRRLFHQIDQWGETYCDMEVSKYIENIKQYFTVIIEISTAKPAYGTYTTFGLYESKELLKLRMQRMKSYQKEKTHKKCIACMLIFGVMAVSTVTVAASGAAFVEGYNLVFEETVVDLEEAGLATVENIPMLRKGKKRNHPNRKIKKVTIQEAKPKIGETHPVEWMVGAKERMQTQNVYLKKGTEVTITVSTGFEENPQDKVAVGLADSKGKEIYIEKRFDLFCCFTITKDETYKIFIENWGNKKAEFLGEYIITKKE